MISGLLMQVFGLPEVCEEVFCGGLCYEEEMVFGMIHSKYVTLAAPN